MIGGGFIGCEVTASLTQLDVQVTHIVREARLFSSLQAPPLSDALAELWRERGVDLRLGFVPAAQVATGPQSGIRRQLTVLDGLRQD